MTTLEIAWLLTALVLLFGSSFMPPLSRYWSLPKRQAVRSAVDAFRQSVALPISWGQTRVYRSLPAGYIVMVTPRVDCLPPMLHFYRVGRDGGDAELLAAGQCHWGIRPEDLWNEDEIFAAPAA